MSDRSYFIAQRDGTAAGLFMSEPVITRSDGRPGIILSRRLEDETGAFAGVVAAIVNLEDLAQFYAAVTLGNGSAVQLLRDDGQLLMRDPPDAAAMEQRFPQLAAPRAQAGRLTNPIDGQARLHCGGAGQGHSAGARGHPRGERCIAFMAR